MAILTNILIILLAIYISYKFNTYNYWRLTIYCDGVNGLRVVTLPYIPQVGMTFAFKIHGYPGSIKIKISDLTHYIDLGNSRATPKDHSLHAWLKLNDIEIESTSPKSHANKDEIIRKFFKA